MFVCICTGGLEPVMMIEDVDNFFHTRTNPPVEKPAPPAVITQNLETSRNIPFGFLMFFGSLFIIFFVIFYYMDSQRKGPYFSDHTNDPLLNIEHLKRKVAQ
jgi:hypothetical protein